MKAALLALLLFLATVSSVYAINGTTTNQIVFTTNDTYICNDNTNPQSCNQTKNFGTQNTVSVAEFSTANAIKDSRAFFKFPAGDQNKIIQNLFLKWQTATSGCNPRNKTLYWQPFDSWDENTMNGTNFPQGFDGSFITGAGKMPVTSGNNTSPDMFLAPNGDISAIAWTGFIGDLYNDSFTTIETDKDLYQNGVINNACGAVTGTVDAVSSKDSFTEAAFLNFTYTNFLEGEVLATDIATTFYDFESGSARSASFPEADFKYDASANTITPLLATMKFKTSELDNTDTMNSQVCSGSGFSSNAISSVNVPTGTYDIYCFNLSSQHGGRQFYGAIKVINNTNVRSGGAVDFDFYEAMYGTAYSTFGNIVLTPTPAQRSRNLTVSWDTTTAQSSVVKFRFQSLVNSSYSALNTVENTSLVTHHSIIIDKSLMTGAFYTMFLQGTDGSGGSFTSDEFNFSTINFQETISDISAGVTFIVQDTLGFPVPNAFVSMTPFPDAAKTDFIHSDSGKLISAVAFCPQAGCPDEVIIGTHNVTVVAEGYLTVTIIGFNVTTQPTFKTISMTAFGSCNIASYYSSNASCVNAGSNSNSPAGFTWACNFNPNKCLIVDVDTGEELCRLNANNTPTGQFSQGFGAWELYSCTGNATVANSGLINQSLPIGTVQQYGGGAPQDIITAIFNPFASLLGTDVDGIKGMIALIISTLAAAFIGIKSREGIVTAFAFLGFVTMFTVISWLPLFVWILMVLIGAFVVAKFFRQTTTPQ